MARTHTFVLALTASVALAGCSVDYAGILAGKACDKSGSCAPDYLCDTASWRCVPVEEIKGPDGGGLLVDGGHGGDDASRDAGFPLDSGPVDAGADDVGIPDDAGISDDAGPVDTGLIDAGPVDAGTGDDAGTSDVGAPDAGADDAGIQVCTPSSYRCNGLKDLEQCRGDGSGYDLSMTCEFGCLNAQCSKCTPNSAWCENAKARTCDSTGQVFTDTDCPKGCDTGSGACYACNALESRCEDESTVATCNGDRSGWDMKGCCVPSTCAIGLCTKPTTPYISGISPGNANVGADVTVVFTGCQFSNVYSYKAIVQMKNSGGQWVEPSNGTITAQTATEIQYLLENIAGPGNTNYELRVHNPIWPTATDSNTVVFHVN